MTLSAPRSIYGIHSISPYSRSTGEFYGILKVLENSSLGVSAELIDLMGGSNKYPWQSEVGAITAEMVLAFSEYPNFVFELFGGNAPTSNAAEANGSVTTLTDVNGTVVDATTGIASISIKAGSESDLKFGKYIVKVTGAAAVDVYLASDIDIARGTNGEYQNDLLKITSTPLTIPGTGGTVEIPNFGLEFTGGSGSISLTTGDTAEFYVRPPNTESMDVVIGRQADQNWPEFGALVLAEKQGSGQMFEVEAYKCKGAGLPIGMARNAFGPAEITVKMNYDSTKDGVFAVRHIIPTTA